MKKIYLILLFAAGSAISVFSQTALNEFVVTKDENPPRVFYKSEGCTPSDGVLVFYTTIPNLKFDMPDTPGRLKNVSAFDPENNQYVLCVQPTDKTIGGITKYNLSITANNFKPMPAYTVININAAEPQYFRIDPKGKIDVDNNGNGNNNNRTTVVTGGLAAYYTFNDETAVDVTGNGYDGALINSPGFVGETPTGSGKAVFLRKVNNQKITMENPINNTGIFTICLWLKDVGSGNIFYGANSNLKLNITNGVFNLHNDSKCRYDGANILQDGKWHHVVIMGRYNGGFFDSWTVNLYVDGVLYGSHNNACVVGTLTSNSSSIYIGGENTLKIDNIRFYDRELSRNEIKEIYNTRQ